MKVTLQEPFQSISGLCNGLVICHQKNGKTYARVPNRPRSTPPTSAEKQMRAKFADIQKMVTEVLASPALRAHYEKGFKAQLTKSHPYTSLRNYVFAQLYHSL